MNSVLPSASAVVDVPPCSSETGGGSPDELAAVNGIRILPPSVVARIAAGEVVERPASIIKELVENSIDAGARSVIVEIAAGGRDLVRVSDDGKGMPASDLALCAQSHATSKLRNAEDLDTLITLGFRGEALPSIAAVSKFSIVSRPRGQNEAWKIEMAGGEPSQPEPRPAAGPFGTTVEARELFFNTPVRSKFLKASASEAAACADTLLRLALTRPSVAFTLKQDRHDIFALLACTNPTDRSEAAPRDGYLRRAREVLGREASKHMVEVSLEGPGLEGGKQKAEGSAETTGTAQPSGYRLFGLVSPPSDSRANRNHIYLTINGRSVKDRTLTSALLEACRHLLPPRRYPAAALFLDVPPSDVDINVHPTKAEVRFRLPGLIYSMLHRAVRTAFGIETAPALESQTPSTRAEEPRQPAPGLWPKAAPAVPRFAPDERLFSNAASEEETNIEPSKEVLFGTPAAVSTRSELLPAEQPQRVAEAAAPFGAKLSPPASRVTLQSASRSPSFATPSQQPVSAPARAPLPAQRSFRVLGQAGGMYIVLEDATGVKLIDQHALHERVLFETFLERAHGRARGDSQGLLLPETLELSPAQAAALHSENEAGEDHEGALAVLNNLGFSVDAFGPRTAIVRAVPAILRSQKAASFVGDVLDAIAAPDETAPQNSPLRRGHYRERAAYMLSCKGAIKAGERLSTDQMSALMDEFYRFAGNGPLTCPHGRPLAVELGWDDLERGVGRK